MADDYEDVYGLESMGDEELRELIAQQMEEHPEVDPDLIEVQVENGFVRLSGRVGTQQEYQVAEAIVADILGIREYANELVLDELVRGEQDPGADVAVAEDREVESQLGEEGEATETNAEHLLEDLQSESYGTHNMQDAIEGGMPYEPPDRPIQMGDRSIEDH
jgi:hypothetical protein